MQVDERAIAAKLAEDSNPQIADLHIPTPELVSAVAEQEFIGNVTESPIGASVRAETFNGVDYRFLVPAATSSRAEEGSVGLDHQMVIPALGTGISGALSPAQVISAYGVTPAGHDTIAVVTAYNYPTALNDFNFFANYFKLPVETSTNATLATNKVFQVVYASGTKPLDNVDWSHESAIDTQWIHVMAPKAKIVLVLAASSSLGDMLRAVDVATKLPGVKVVSMSWGTSEFVAQNANDSHFNVSGVLFFAASGDKAGVVSYPSSSPYVCAVGGTSLVTDIKGGFSTETAWANAGCGNSKYSAKPLWQNKVTTISGTYRATPDISCVANPATGVNVYCTTVAAGSTSKGGWYIFGGTSLATPIVAGMVNSTGFAYTGSTPFMTGVYNNFSINKSVFRDIVSGKDATYSAGAGWDYPTGIGAPLGPKAFSF
jgi:subtilase family serine protease